MFRENKTSLTIGDDLPPVFRTTRSVRIYSYNHSNDGGEQ